MRNQSLDREPSMNDISIVTAFFDIGRGGWTADKGLPPYLQRTTQTYLERFGHLAKLENEMVVYTSQDMVRAIQSLRQGRPTVIVTLDFPNSFTQLRRQISEVQNNPEYQKQINPRQARNPEYWNADYIVVNALKSFFVKKAIESGCLHNELCAWLDFGYCRDESALHGIKNGGILSPGTGFICST
jgi:protein YibB